MERLTALGFCTFDINLLFSNLSCSFNFFIYRSSLSVSARNYLYFYNSFFREVIYSDYDFFFCIEGLLLSTLSKMALFALLANCRVENVSAEAVKDGLMQIMNLIFPCPKRESLRILVNFEFLKGMCVLDLSIRAEMQCPRHERLPLMLVNS